jgi:hypothetical protein
MNRRMKAEDVLKLPSLPLFIERQDPELPLSTILVKYCDEYDVPPKAITILLSESMKNTLSQEAHAMGLGVKPRFKDEDDDDEMLGT